MTKKVWVQIAVFLSLFVLMMGFQNCADVGFSGSTEASSISGSSNISSIINNELPSRSTTIDNVNQYKDLIEFEGNCDKRNGVLSAENDILNSGNETICAEGKFRMCVKLQHTGYNEVAVSSKKPNDVINNSLFTTTVTVEDRVFDFQQVSVTSSTKANITVDCLPGAAITAEIYGVSQLPTPLICPQAGKASFNVKLVASLANTGQRVVTVRQLMENGFITEIFTDVDNVNSAHTCSIDSGSAHESICHASAGEVSGRCKPGTPVKIFVNGIAQESEVCDSGGAYSFENILTNSSIQNEIIIEQKNVYTGSSCTDTVLVRRLSEI